MTTIPDTSNALLISRMFAAVRERVFHAWTNAKELHQWWHAGDAFAPDVAEADVRIGGHYRLGMISPETGQELSTGEFREIDPPEHLRMTWLCSTDPVHHQMNVSVDFFDHGKNTELVLVHDGFLSHEECETYRRNWTAMFGQLATFFHTSASPPIELCVTVDVSEDKVFRALTDAQELMHWFPTLVENDPVPGGKFSFSWEFPDDPTRNHMRCGEYTEVIPYKSIVHTWDARPMHSAEDEHTQADSAKHTIVEFRLTPEAEERTKVTLVHSGWGWGAEWDELKENHLRGWTFFLTNLKSYLESGNDERAKELGMRCAEVVQGITY